MFGISTLKDRINLGDDWVDCPVRDCNRRASRQRRKFLREDQFACSEHRIFISPSTFEYFDYRDNLLWRGIDDVRLLEGPLKLKRESRLARDNSEDAVTWNILRALEKVHALESWITRLGSLGPGPIKLAYWSCDPDTLQVYERLAKARKAFDERMPCSSEPDVIAFGRSALIFIEAKLTSGNRTIPSKPDDAERRYTRGGTNWYDKVVKSPFKTVAINKRFYELLRLWLLGTWAADQLGIPFLLINLTTSQRERDVENSFGGHIATSSGRRFMRATWEGVLAHIKEVAPGDVVTQRLDDYMRHKTAGYDQERNIRAAFSLPGIQLALAANR